MKKKLITVINAVNGERWICDSYQTGDRVIDGVDYVYVYKPENSKRKLLMRKDALKIDSVNKAS